MKKSYKDTIENTIFIAIAIIVATVIILLTATLTSLSYDMMQKHPQIFLSTTVIGIIVIAIFWFIKIYEHYKEQLNTRCTE